MTTLAIISATLFVIYLVLMAKLHGIQPSISDNYYVAKHPWSFTLAMWTVAFTMLPPMLSATTETFQFTAFLSCAGIAFVGAAAAYKQQLTNQVHIAGAATAALMSIVWAYTICPPSPPSPSSPPPISSSASLPSPASSPRACAVRRKTSPYIALS